MGGEASRLTVLAGVAALAAGLLFAQPAIPQDAAFHLFADARAICGISNFWNVMSNLPFAVSGLLGLAVMFWRRPATGTGGVWLALGCFYIGVALVAAGSAYYHAAPDNDRLFWDRLPMTVAFTALLAGMLADRGEAARRARWLLPLFVTAGAASLLYWQWSEGQGAGDLRPYLLVQALPMVLLLPLLVLFPRSRVLPTRCLVAMALIYGLALVCSSFDREIYQALQGTMSGHSVKHLLAAIATVMPTLALLERSPRWAQSPAAAASPLSSAPRISS